MSKETKSPPEAPLRERLEKLERDLKLHGLVGWAESLRAALAAPVPSPDGPKCVMCKGTGKGVGYVDMSRYVPDEPEETPSRDSRAQEFSDARELLQRAKSANEGWKILTAHEIIGLLTLLDNLIPVAAQPSDPPAPTQETKS